MNARQAAVQEIVDRCNRKCMCPLGLAIFNRFGGEEDYDVIRWSFPEPVAAARRLEQSTDECDHIAELWDTDEQTAAVEEAIAIGLFEVGAVR